jgi:hypothetical protein
VSGLFLGAVKQACVGMGGCWVAESSSC